MDELILRYVFLKLENKEISKEDTNLLMLYAENAIRDYQGFAD